MRGGRSAFQLLIGARGPRFVGVSLDGFVPRHLEQIDVFLTAMYGGGVFASQCGRVALHWIFQTRCRRRMLAFQGDKRLLTLHLA